MEKAVKIYFPRWISVFYIICAVILIPWIVVLADLLPSRHVARHWDALWVGFDVLILITIVLTIYFMVKKRIWVIMTATALATLLLVDIWFDLLTAKPGSEQFQAVVSGLIELFLSFLTYRMVYHVLHQSTPEKSMRMVMESKKSHT
jgi:hypothetical protein